ncbi:MAG: hypothetical protein IKM16_05035 [Clostridia bacterium]|nr:hypothetical protein [Clostridia bacterium]MBQ7224113.1 hypothetical protein [Clostridia bacterium]MBR6774010.1 hypothetical protein [Clostridia bacterium]MBR7141531.1 hypothetical protein [Clostridia bacterium]
MSIGKSAIKRVTNNGYSQVKTDAPDMQNSSVIPAPSQEVMDKIVTPIEKKTTKKTTKKSTAKKTVTQSKNGFERVEVGENLPYYLL